MRGALKLGGTRLLLLTISFITSIVLARLLDPRDFGTFAVLAFLVMGVGNALISGLGAGLIQKKEALKREEINAVLVIQVATTLVVLTALVGTSKLWGDLFQLEPRTRFMTTVLGGALMCLVLAGPSQAILARRMDWARVSTIQIWGGLVFSAVAVGGAFAGWGVWSFVAALASQMVLTAVMSFASAPYRPGVRFSWSRARGLVRFGLLLQGGSVSSLLRDNLAPLLAGPLFGARAVGYLSWATNSVAAVSQHAVAVATNISFPAFSRLQDNLDDLAKAFRWVLRYTILLSSPLLAILVALGPALVTIVYTDRWAPALPALYWMALRMLGGYVTTPCISLLNAMGRSGLTFKVLWVWTVLDVALAVVCIRYLGFTGVAVAYGIGVLAPMGWLLLDVRRAVKVPIWSALVRPLLPGITVAAVGAWAWAGRVHTPGDLVLAGGSLFGGYVLLVLLFERGLIFSELTILMNLVRHARAATAEKVNDGPTQE